MTTRVLPPQEYDRLAHTELATVWPHYADGAMTVFVVEDEHGEIVGCWAVLRILHLEGLWIHPAHRTHGSVGRRLLTKARQMLHGLGVVTNSVDPDITAYLERVGAVPIPGQAFFWQMTNTDTAAHVGHMTESCDTSGA